MLGTIVSPNQILLKWGYDMACIRVVEGISILTVADLLSEPINSQTLSLKALKAQTLNSENHKPSHCKFYYPNSEP